MNRNEIQANLLTILATIAPEMDPQAMDPEMDLREQLDIDSMDLLNFITAVHKQMGVNIPEADYPKLTSLAACVDYIAERL
ncbi:MAG TPA: acyl carrier protein [Candidatus Macondimonas sp.]|nr:acyl carrier protein [Candidatus Macondimonas sp.]